MFAAFVGKPRGAMRNSHPPLTTASRMLHCVPQMNGE